jgi:hypothetical protein
MTERPRNLSQASRDAVIGSIKRMPAAGLTCDPRFENN